MNELNRNALQGLKAIIRTAEVYGAFFNGILSVQSGLSSVVLVVTQQMLVHSQNWCHFISLNSLNDLVGRLKQMWVKVVHYLVACTGTWSGASLSGVWQLPYHLTSAPVTEIRFTIPADQDIRKPLEVVHEVHDGSLLVRHLRSSKSFWSVNKKLGELSISD